jgi:hypothetical protein
MYPVYVIGKENSESFFFHSRLTRMRRNISSTMLGITWETDRQKWTNYLAS